MNALVSATQSLVPANISEAVRLAEMMAGAKLVPQGLQKSPPDCLLVVMQAVRWQMDPFAVAQECSVIQGKLMHSGKLVAAVVNARGNLAERLSFVYSGEGDSRTISVSGRFQGESDARSVSVRLKDARTTNRVWQSQPDQQLMYHGCRVWARRHAPELMLGIYSPEEFDEGNGAPPKRTQAEISANAAKRWRDIDQIQEDILQIKSEAAIERYAREVLTPETMAALGEKQWIAEQWLEERRRELTGHVELEPAGPPIHVDLAGRGKRKEKPQDSIAEAEAGLPPPADPAKWPISEGIDTKSEYVRWAHDQIESIASVEELHRWWGDEVPQRARFRFTPAETEAMKKRCASRRRELEAPVGK